MSEFLEYARRPAPELEAVDCGPLLDEVRELTRAAERRRVVVDVPPRLPRTPTRASSGARCSTWRATRPPRRGTGASTLAEGR